MPVGLRTLAASFALLLAASRAPSQLLPYPDWARSQAKILFAPESRTAFLPPELAACHERVRRLFRPCHTTQLAPRWGWFSGFVNDRIIAVEPPAAGLDSGLDGVDYLELESPTWLGRDFGMLIIVGRRGGASVIRLAMMRATKVRRRPDSELEVSRAELHPEWVFDFPDPIAARPGEVFVRASLFGTTLYVIEGVAPKVIRFLDTDGDLLPDLRDPSFSVQLPDSMDANYPIAFGFAPASGDFVVAFDDGCCRGPRRGIQDLGGTYVIAPYQYRFDRNVEYVHVNQTVSAGQERLQAQGPSSRTLVIESAPAANGPWTPRSDPTTMASSTPQIIALASPLEAGTFLRAKTAPLGNVTMPKRVAPRHPVLFHPLVAAGIPGATVTLAGDNLAAPIDGTFRPFDGSAAVPVEVAGVSKLQLDLIVPSLSPTGGFVELRQGGPGGGSLRFLLLVQ